MTSVAVFLLIAVITIPGHSYPVERDKDVINNEQPAITHDNNENELNSNDDYAEYDDDDEMSVYKRLENEDENILT